jgi:hypothetical protein
MEALVRNRTFVMEYTDVRIRWRDGAAAMFPLGTYWLQCFASVPVLANDVIGSLPGYPLS